MFTFNRDLGQDIINWLKNFKRTAIILVVIALVLVFILPDNNPDNVSTEETSLPTVEVQAVADLALGRLFTTVGTAQALSEARLQTESGGRVTAVYAEIGDTVQAGSILATLENNSERAALLQAEGSYEAAEAAAASSEIGTRDAELKLADAYRDLESTSNATYGVAQDILTNVIDVYYANPNTSYPTLRLATLSTTEFLSAERLKLQQTLPEWVSFNFSAKNQNEFYRHGEFVSTELNRLLNLVDIFRTAINDTKNRDRYTEVERAALNAELTGARAKLVTAESSMRQAVSTLKTAVQDLERAKISGANSGASLASAQLKQALGAYRAAQANFEKTIVRTPITGVVNALYLKAGDFVSPNTPAAIVANNNGLEVATAVNEEDARKLTIGDTVSIDKIATGTISAIAGAIDPTTGKVAVKIALDATSAISNGTTVAIDFSPEVEKTVTAMTIPLSAVKITGSGPVVFTVNENSTLQAMAVVLGPVTGSTVLITDGLTLETRIIVDARGLKEGQEVTTISK